MKPSNTGFSDPSIKTGTGIDWLKEWQECEDVPILSAMLVYKGDTDKGFIDLCEWAAQIAIAEYQKELVEKAEKLPRRKVIGRSAAGGNFCIGDTKPSKTGDYLRRSEVLALLNENDQ